MGVAATVAGTGRGYRQIPLLLSSMANAVSKKPIAKGAAVA
jgi:hypothetical protein